MAYSPDRYTNDPDYKEGMDCFLKGDFDGAMEHFRDAADNGNPEAEFRIAKSIISEGGPTRTSARHSSG